MNNQNNTQTESTTESSQNEKCQQLDANQNFTDQKFTGQNFSEIFKQHCNQMCLHHEHILEKVKSECNEYKALSTVFKKDKSKLQIQCSSQQEQIVKLHREFEHLKNLFEIQLSTKNRELESKSRELYAKSQELVTKNSELIEERLKMNEQLSKLITEPINGGKQMADKQVETECVLTEFLIDDLKPLAPFFEKHQNSFNKSEMENFAEMTQISDIESLYSEDEARVFENTQNLELSNDGKILYDLDGFNEEWSATDEENLKNPFAAQKITDPSPSQRIRVLGDTDDLSPNFDTKRRQDCLASIFYSNDAKNTLETDTEQPVYKNPPDFESTLNESDIHLNFETTLTLEDPSPKKSQENKTASISNLELPLTPTQNAKRTRISELQSSAPVNKLPVTPILTKHLKSDYTPKFSRSLSRVKFSHEDEFSDGNSASKLIKSKSFKFNEKNNSFGRKRLNFGVDENSESEICVSNNKENNAQSIMNTSITNLSKTSRNGKRGRKMIEAGLEAMHSQQKIASPAPK